MIPLRYWTAAHVALEMISDRAVVSLAAELEQLPFKKMAPKRAMMTGARLPGLMTALGSFEAFNPAARNVSEWSMERPSS